MKGPLSRISAAGESAHYIRQPQSFYRLFDESSFRAARRLKESLHRSLSLDVTVSVTLQPLLDNLWVYHAETELSDRSGTRGGRRNHEHEAG